MSDASTCRVATRTRSRSTHWPKGKGCRALSRIRSQHRRYHQGVGLPRAGFVACLDLRNAPRVAYAYCRSIRRVSPAASSEAGSGHRAVHAKESAKALAQKLGVCRPTLYNWKNQLLGPEVSPSMKCRLEPSSSPEREELQRQLESLHLDVRRLQLEHDLLMRANELIKKRRASTGKS